MKTKEQIRAYNKEYFARPEVIARAKVRNSARRHVRKAYKKTKNGRAVENAYRRRRYAQISDLRRAQRYGLTPEAFAAMLQAQAGMCLLCSKSSSTKLHVDHCHRTGIVRGLLCGSCNRGLGLFKDDIEILSRAIAYLKQYV